MKDSFAWNKTIQEMTEKDKDTEWTWADEDEKPLTRPISEIIREKLLTDDEAFLGVINECIHQIQNERDLKNSDGFRVAKLLLDDIIWVSDHKKSLT